MRDLSEDIRVGVFTALSGNTGGINMYDEKRKVNSSDTTFIVLSTQQQTPDTDSNDCTWVSKCFIDIEVYQKTGSEVSKNIIDRVANTVLTVLLPSVGVTPVVASNVQLANPYCESIISRNLSLSETESILQKVIRFAVTAIQQSN